MRDHLLAATRFTPRPGSSNKSSPAVNAFHIVRGMNTQGTANRAHMVKRTIMKDIWAIKAAADPDGQLLCVDDGGGGGEKRKRRNVM